ncbi:MAG: EamA family transporter RarD [Sporomusaceae bacterium]|nr:EamA family transporter RarD [Sporomusaceae bacterium]
MNVRKLDEKTVGVVCAIGAYVFWGILPIYWKFLREVPATEVLAHRILWSLFFMLCILLVTKRMRSFVDEFRQISSNPKQFAGVIMAALFISVNWCTYIWAVNDNRIIETSLGYYINPLVSVLLGILVLKEKLSFWQIVSFVLAVIGVFIMALYFGGIPWVSLVLAVSFAFYSLCKKIVNIGAITSITIETIMISPIALIYVAYIEQQGIGHFAVNSWDISGFLMGSGVVTAIPLILFAKGANRLPLALLGFVQYVSPTISLLVGIFLFNEAFTIIHCVSFGFIWLALIVFSLAKNRHLIEFQSILLKKYYVKSQMR